MYSDDYWIFRQALQTLDLPERVNTLIVSDVTREIDKKIKIQKERDIVLQAFEYAIDDSLPGFRQGWVALSAVMRLVIKADLPWSFQKCSKFVREQGFIPHPGLHSGRTTRSVAPANTLTTLFVRPDHPTIARKRPSEVMRAYDYAQSL